ncbi:MAG: tRNA uridine-5-carboxymethylaminomethyl(34) synthesis GTPase MnmE [Candidatus Margulisbacteria bacterium]|jgi:tRNA modification GTPase|nr:tRNA uridine-5-carboxymethylaminomethyl(34) synthesis GTPase MnmE [Candidatus Margulisiibacteriota bacterium]
MSPGSATIAAIATPPGTGGIAIVRVSGPDAPAIARRLTDRRNLAPNTIHRCALYSADRTQKLDDGLLAFFQAPHSYTGEDVAEFNCHGSDWLARKILEQCLLSGARLSAPGEFTRRAFLAGKLDLTQAEAVAELISAGGELSLALALRHLEGDVSAGIKNLRAEFLAALAGLEAALDYPEEIDAPAPAGIINLLQAAQRQVAQLLADSSRGLLIKSGANIVLAGKPNSGKSSLFNALLKYDRAIVTEIPGTTRDALEAEVSLGGLRVNLIDTAGLREAADQIERLGIERSRAHMQSAELVLFLLDAETGLTPAERQILADLEGTRHLVLINKCDLPHSLDYPGALPVSARTGANLDLLEQKILESLNLRNIDLSKKVYISSLRQKDRLIRAAELIARTLESSQTVAYLDLLAAPLKAIVVTLGELTGEETSAEIIEEIFANFCVGK